MTRVIQGSHSHTCLYSPAVEHHRPLAGTHCTYPRINGQAELTWAVGYTEISSAQLTETDLLILHIGSQVRTKITATDSVLSAPSQMKTTTNISR